MKKESTSLKSFLNPKIKPRILWTTFAIVLLIIFNLTADSLPASESSYKDIDQYESRWERVDWKHFLLKGLHINSENNLSLAPKKVLESFYYFPKRDMPDGILFSGIGSKMEIPNSHLKELGVTEITRRISILLSFKPSIQKDQMILFEKVIFRNGLEYGIRGSLDNHLVKIELIRFFKSIDGRNTSGIVYSNQRINKKEWNHLAIFFDPLNLSVQLYLNELQVGEFKDNSRDTISMGFHKDDNTNLHIGVDYFGRLSNLRFFYGEPNFQSWNHRYHPATYYNESKLIHQEWGEGISPVYRSKLSHTELREIDFKNIDVSPNTLWDLQFRFSNKPFQKNLSEEILKWTSFRHLDRLQTCDRLESNRKDTDDSLINCFQFYQFRIALRSDPKGDNTPNLPNFHYNLFHTIPPKKVKSLAIGRDSDGDNLKVCLEWKGNEELNVWNGGTYTIHYGFREDALSGRITIPIQERKDKYNFCLDNNILKSQSENLKMERNLPFFRKGTTVFFRVSAENRFYSEEGAGRDQISELSQLVSFHFPF